MLNLRRLISLVLLLTHAAISGAEDMLVDVNILYTMPSAGGSDDFHTGKIVSVNYNYYYLPWLAATAGVFASEEIFDKPQIDVVGNFQASIETRGVTLGLRPEYVFSKRNKVYARVGILFYTTKLTVEEFFATGLPAGSTSGKTNGYGYLASLAWSHSLTEKISFQLELSNMTQLDLFEESSKSFDLNNTGFSVGLGYAF